MNPWRHAAACCGLLVCLLAPVLEAQTEGPLVTPRYTPGLRFHTISTGRFDIHFHQGEEALARRLVRIVEQVAPEVERRFGAPSGRVRVILVDQTDVSNGWATVIPYNLIEIAAVPPAAESQIGHTDDWLRLVFTHEYTHVVHLEQSRGWFGSLRHVFGRIPVFYPNLFVPDWQIEGLATHEESALTGRGRIRAGDFRMVLDRAAAAGRFPSLDRATTGVIDWPGGASAYLYGGFFHQFLADRYGAESLARLARETAGRLPFAGSRAFRTVYGKPLGALWKEFEASATGRASALAPARPDPRTRLTTHGFTVAAPAFTGDGRLYYSTANPHRFPALMEWRDGEAPREITSLYHGRRIGAAGGTLVFDQLEVVDHVALQSDLYAVDTRTAKTRRLTTGARASDPDVTADGRTIVCTVQETGRRYLATLDLAAAGTVDPSPLVSEASTEFSAPRWSPDGRSIVAERRRLQGPSEIVVVDRATREVRTVFSTANGRAVTPAWLPDGRILFAWDREGAPFTLYAIDPSSRAVRQLAGAGMGARSPALSPDRRRLVFVGYSAEGYDLYAIPFESAEWVDLPAVQAEVPRPAATLAESQASSEPAASRPYSPMSTLAPRFWVPYVEGDGDDVVIGAGTAGFDALGRHTYALTAGWAVPRNRADVQADYSYTRWWPALFAGVSDDTDSWRAGYIRSRDVSAGVLLPFARVRWHSDVFASGSYSTDELLSQDDRQLEPTRRRTAGRLGWSVSNAKGFGYSISPEQGGTLSLVSELAAGGTGGGSARTLIAEARGYQRLFPRHGVLAARVAAALSRGDARVRRDFTAGGNGPQGSGFDVGFDAIGLLRGFDDGDVIGRSAAVVNVDYRFPLAWPQRGIGTLPFFLRAVHGAVFADAGHAWDGSFRAADARRSAGAELSFDLLFGGLFSMTATGGVAWRHDPSRAREGAVAFARVGRAF